MTKKSSPPQSSPSPKIRDTNERLYHLIRKRVKWTTFCRLNIDPDEVASEVYLLLLEQTLPDFDTVDFRIMLRNTVKRIIWDCRRPTKQMLDVDELDEEEHPFYEVDFFSEEREFELVFSKFCKSFPEPKRTVYSRCRVLTRWDISELTGLSRSDVAKILKAIADDFRIFLANFQGGFSAR